MENIQFERLNLIVNKKNLLIFYKLFENLLLKNIINLKLNEKEFSPQFIDELISNILKFNSNEFLSECFDMNEKFKYQNYISKSDEYLIFKSYPKYNYLLILSNNLLLSFYEKKFIFKFEELNGFTDNTKINIEKINVSLFLNNTETVNKILEKIESNYKDYDEFDQLMLKILLSIGQRGLLTFLGVRHTSGSIDNYLPTDITILINEFNQLNTKEFFNKKGKCSVLSVGAKALSKHSHRSSEVFHLF